MLLGPNRCRSLWWRLKAAPMVWEPVNFRGVPQADPANVVSLPGYQNRGSENNVFVATGVGIEARDVIPAGQGGHRGEFSKTRPQPHLRHRPTGTALICKKRFFSKENKNIPHGTTYVP